MIFGVIHDIIAASFIEFPVSSEVCFIFRIFNVVHVFPYFLLCTCYIPDTCLTDITVKLSVDKPAVIIRTSYVEKPVTVACTGKTFLFAVGKFYFRELAVAIVSASTLVFSFDVAHLIFKDAPQSLLDKIEQIVRLIRSKGIGIYFITQQPTDVPESVLAQLGNKLQHALRAYTPKERKSLKATAQSFRENPALDAEAALGELGTGEVLVSTLDPEGIPSIVQRAYVMPPRSYLGVCDDAKRQQLIKDCPLYSKYAEAVDRESAYELLTQKAEEAHAEAEAAAKAEAEAKEAALREKEEAKQAKEAERADKAAERERIAAERAAQRSSGRQTKSVLDKVFDSAVNSATRTVGSQIGSKLVRGILGSLFKGK